MKHFGTKLYLLLWKNWKVRLHQPFQTAFFFLCPVISSLVLLYLRSIVPAETYDHPIAYEPYDPGDAFILMSTRRMGTQSKTAKESKELAWSPRKSSSKSFTRDCRTLITKAFSELMTLREFSSEEELETYLLHTARLDDVSSSHGPMTLAGVVFADLENPDDPKLCSKRLQITLRFPSILRMGDCFESVFSNHGNWKTEELFPLIFPAGARDNEQNPNAQLGACPLYTLEGFTVLQTLLSRTVVEQCSSKRRANNFTQRSSNLLLRRFSYPEYTVDEFHKRLKYGTAFLSIIGLSISFYATLKDVSVEKEHKMKETMKIMGLPTTLHWIGWFITMMILLLIPNCLFVLIFKWKTAYGAILNETSSTVLFVLLLLFSAAQTCFAFFMSTFFSRASVAGSISGFIYVLLLVTYLIIDTRYDAMDINVKFLSCSLFIFAFGIGLRMLTQRENAGCGQHWSNMWEPLARGDHLTFGYILIILFVDCIIYMLMTLYIDAIYPGNYGVPKPWYFPFQKSFWWPERPSVEAEDDIIVRRRLTGNFEVEPRGRTAGIQIRNLTKEFPGRILAVRNVSLNVYEGHITVIVGQNGAGKTTTFSMLTGMFPPTQGTALVNGYDVRTSIEAVRENLGFCPEHNVLFDELTVREHLYFFGRLKGLSGKALKDEIDHFVRLIQLQDKQSSLSYKLSGGMKRKLAAGVALCGKSKVVIFDEPTSGMDPTARRALWDVLRIQKFGRTLLLTTHFMDEADLLGDRIAIMAGGRLHCCGTSFFLKKHYGAGYRLVVVKGPRCKTSEVTGVLARHMPGLVVSHEMGSELSYQLDESRAANFEGMLKDLEKQRETLGIINFGVSLTTMEDVFLKAIKVHGERSPSVAASQMSSEGQSSTSALSRGPAAETMGEVFRPQLTGWRLLGRQMRAMFLKRFLIARRDWILVLLNLMIGPLLMLFYFQLMKVTIEMRPRLSMSLENYTNPITVLAVGSTNDPMADNYKDVVSKYSETIVLRDQDNAADGFEKYILNKFRDSHDEARKTYIIGASFDKDATIGWFNALPYHSVPLALNMLYNALLKSLDMSLDIVNHPIPYTGGQSKELEAFDYGESVQILILTMSVVTCYIILLPIRERANNAKHLQMISGANAYVFWGVHFVCDFVYLMICCVGAIIVLHGYQKGSTPEDLGNKAIVLVCFVWEAVPFVYLSSFLFRVPAVGFSVLLILNIFVGSMGRLVIYVLQVMEYISTSEILEFVLFVHPLYTITAIDKLWNYSELSNWCRKQNVDCSEYDVHECCPDKCPSEGCVSEPANYFQWLQPGIQRHMLAFLLWGFVYFALILLLDTHSLDWLFTFIEQCVVVICKRRHDTDEVLDRDVTEERDIIRFCDEKELSNYSVVLRDVTKYYGTFLAVDCISIGVRKGECFGLLGLNGAGKTTSFKMMTGDLSMTKGEGYLEGFNLRKQRKKVQQKFGYCPQFDALIEKLTCREILRIFCLLRGYNDAEIISITIQLADDLIFTQHLDRKVKDCSGGTKRKLSLAVALVGSPPVLFLDEPTTGMDPEARRHVWNMIIKYCDSGNSVVLTSHSMEECEVLCTRLVIMVNGSFKCLGSLQYLKSKFAEGYTLIIKVMTSRESFVEASETSAVKSFVSLRFPDAILKEEYLGILTYHIPSSNFTWSQLFGMMEKAKKELNVEDYSLGQTSLEQIFLTLTKSQRLQE